MPLVPINYQDFGVKLFGERLSRRASPGNNSLVLLRILRGVMLVLGS